MEMTFLIEKQQYVTYWEESFNVVKIKYPTISYTKKNCASCKQPTTEIKLTYQIVDCLYFLGVEYAKRRF